MKTYFLKPIITPQIVTPDSVPDKPAVARPLPAYQPLPRPVIDPARSTLQLGLDAHLEFIMVVAQRDHASPKAPRKLSPQELVAQVKAWTAEGLQVFCVQESCGFGFVLHRELVAAGAQSFLITPVDLSGKRKTDKLDAQALALTERTVKYYWSHARAWLIHEINATRTTGKLSC